MLFLSMIEGMVLKIMEKVFFNQEPKKIKYMAKPNGKADIWLRGNIKQETIEQKGQEQQIWTAYERFIPDSELTLTEAQANYFSLFVDASSTQAMLTKAVQDYMDATVQARGYDSIATACTYATSTDETFAHEGQCCVHWRDKVWRYCYTTLDEVLAGERDIPTAEELISELPELVW